MRLPVAGGASYSILGDARFAAVVDGNGTRVQVMPGGVVYPIDKLQSLYSREKTLKAFNAVVAENAES